MRKDRVHYSAYFQPFSDLSVSVSECHVAVVDSPGLCTCSIHRQHRQVEIFIKLSQAGWYVSLNTSPNQSELITAAHGTLACLMQHERTLMLLFTRSISFD